MTDHFESVWLEQERWARCGGLPPPFWSIAWPGGQALARYTLDHPNEIRNRAVLDFGSGCGICAIAAAKAGARSVAAYDIDLFAREVLRMNACLNSIELETLDADVIDAPSRWDVILAADMWYERFLAQRVNSWLRTAARHGTRVLLGDCGRAFFPKYAASRRSEYIVSVPRTVNYDGKITSAVWSLH